MALLLILLLASGLRYVGYNFSLPYIDHPDEPNHNLAAQMIIDWGTAKPLNYHGYPPGIITLNYLFLRFFHDQTLPSSTVIPWVRLTAITVSIGTIIIIGLLAYQLSFPIAGLLAAWLWAICPTIVEHSRYAVADPFVTFFAVLAIWLIISGTVYDRDRWTTAGTVALIFAILFKYQAIFLLPLVIGIPLWRLLGKGIDKRRIIGNVMRNVAYIAVFLFWLVALYPSLEADAAPYWVASPEQAGIPTRQVLQGNLRIVVNSIQSTHELTIGFLGLTLLARLHFRRHVNLLGLSTVFASAVVWLLGVSVFGRQGIRQFLGLGAFMITLTAVGLSLWIKAFCERLERLSRSGPLAHRTQLFVVVLLGAIGVMTFPHLQHAIKNTYEHTLHDRRNDLARYMDTSLTPGAYISDIDNHKTFNREWGGYPGQHEFPYVGQAVVTQDSIENWRARGVLYAIVPFGEHKLIQESPKWKSYLDEMLLLKTYPPSDHYRGPAMAVYRLYPIQHKASGCLGPICLIGYDIDRTEILPGQTITFTLYWKAVETPDRDYTVYNHLTPLNSRDIVAQIDGPPLPDERRPTYTWDDPYETLVSRSFVLTIPSDVAPGQYDLITGFYQRDFGDRLLSANGNDFLRVSRITVKHKRQR